ncbi:PD-(D/E)XK motif protein [Bradyrhizobium sp. ORS 86]|uniref:PD-(D/E)XK motif protein n=1 Tax=Bradyrhizobium sp. ORS 86 TaxID=1685970 RepID=UPI003890A1EE
MIGRLRQLLDEITPSSGEGVFNVQRLEDASSFYVGRDSRGHSAILVATSEIGRTVPLRLAGIEAMFSMPCEITEPGTPPAKQTLTVVTCTNQDRNVEAYFASVMESLLPLLGDRPSTSRVEEVVRNVVDLFQKLRNPSRRSLVGLLGELVVIEGAEDAAAAVTAWRSDPDERFDFALGRVRLDVKASSHRQRVHEISFEQANPPAEMVGIIASVWIEGLGGGISLAEFLDAIEARLVSRPAEILRLRTIVADSLGDTLPQAMSWRFDQALARKSVCYYRSGDIPAIRPPLPDGVSSARFVSDLSGSRPIDPAGLARDIGAAEQSLLPQLPS